MTTFRYMLVVVFLISGVANAGDINVITKDSLVEMFANISKKTTWDMSGPMLWGYFFTDSSPQKLESVVSELEKGGYRYVEIFQADKESQSEPDVWWLHVEKVEIHSPETLNIRNQQLYEFARKHGLDSYDGMDVGPASGKS